MVTVSANVINNHLSSPKIKQIYTLFTKDVQIQQYLRMANVMAVKRLNYNDHGPVHAKIASGSALEIFDMLIPNLLPTSVEHGRCDIDDAKLIVFAGSYLHDIGNSVHRTNHHIHGCYLAASILERILPQIYPNDQEIQTQIQCEILHTIYAHDENEQCLSIEAGIAKIADGTDMASGRARYPYRVEDTDIHSISALAITKVAIEKSNNDRIRLLVFMKNPAGIFQIEEVLGEKIKTSGLAKNVEVLGIHRGKVIKSIEFPTS